MPIFSTRLPPAPSATVLSVGQFRKRYLVALSLIALLTIGSQWVVQLLILDQEHDSRVVNIAGRQRMLSQKLSKLTLYIASATSVAEAAAYRIQLQDTLDLWQSSHRGLLKGDAVMELPGSNSAAVLALFKTIEPDHQAMVAAVQSLLANPQDEAVLHQTNAAIRQYEPFFLKGRNDIVFLYDQEARQKIAFARWLEVSLLLVTLLVLVLEAMFIFAPATRRIHRDMQALADHEEDFERLFEASPIAMLLVDSSKLCILKVNTKAMTFLGLTYLVAGTTSLRDFVRQNDEGNRYFFDNLSQMQVLDEFELALTNTRCEEFHTLVSVRKMKFSGLPVLVLGITDITERKLVESELSIAATAFESQEGMFITNARKEIIRVNKAFTSITGYLAAEAIGRTPAMLSSGRHDAAFYAAMHDCIERTGSWQGEIWNRRKSGETFPEWLTITAVRDSQQVLTHFVSTLTDITLRKAAEKEIRHLAFYDPLTQLPNRRLLMDRLQQAMAITSRRQAKCALLFLDLDHFKTLNDTLGHHKGDQLLQQVAARLSVCVRDGDTVARLGGDEFVVLLENLNASADVAVEEAGKVGEKILLLLNQPYDLSGDACHNTPSIGITLFADQQNDVEDLLKRADMAMYAAKAAGRNTLRFFDAQTQLADPANRSPEA